MAAERQELVGSAEKLVSRGRIRAAIEQYRKILEDAPDDTGTLNRVGDLYVRIGRLDKAIGLFQRTARHFVRQGFLVKAIAILKKIIRLDPTLMDVYESLADLYQRQGLVSDARAQFQVVAEYYQNHGDLQRCAAIHLKLVDLEPDDPTHRLRLAEFYEELDDSSGAMEQYRGIAKLMLAQGEVADAARVSLKALELNPQDLGFLAALVQDFHDSGRSVEAKDLVARAIEINPAAEGIEELAGLAEESGESDPRDEVAGAVDVAAETAGLGEDATIPLPGQGQVEIWTSEGRGQGLPTVDLRDVAEISFGEEAEETPDTAETAPVVGDGALEPASEFEFDLADLGVSPGAESEAAEEAADGLEQERVASPSSGEAARSDQVHPKSGRTVDELFSEAEVLQRYGLGDKAAELLEELLEMDSRHLGALTRLVYLQVELRRTEPARQTADRLKAAAWQLGVPSVWEEVAERLERDGVTIAETTLAEEITGDSPTALPAPVEEPAGELVPGMELLGESDGEEGFLEGDLDFFDLASELEAELDDVTDDQDLLIPIQEEQSLEEIVAGFRRGMQETLSAEDYETHFNLGIAYREMELVDEAIGEFQLAAKDPRHLIECCSLLANCFVSKGLPELAVKWYERGLTTPGLTEQERLGLLYELGDLHLEHGDTESAKSCFVEIYGASSNFRDVVARIKELDAPRK